MFSISIYLNLVETFWSKILKFLINLVFSDHFLAPNERQTLSGISAYPNLQRHNTTSYLSCVSVIRSHQYFCPGSACSPYRSWIKRGQCTECIALSL